MSKLFVFTAGNDAARAHLQVSIRNPIPPTKVLPYIDGALRERLQMRSEHDGLFAWGAIPGEQNRLRWEQMEAGDWVLGVFNQTYHFAAQVMEKVESRPCAEAIWGTDTNGNTWQLMYFLDRPREIAIPCSGLAGDLPESYQGFFKPSAKSLAKLEEKYGSIDAFVQERFLSPSQTSPCFILRSNDGTPYGDRIGEIYHYASTVPNYTKLADGADVIVDRKTGGGVLLLGWGRLGKAQVNSSPPPGQQGTSYLSPFEEWHPFDPPKETPADWLAAIKAQAGYNVQHAVRPLTRALFDEVAVPAVNQKSKFVIAGTTLWLSSADVVEAFAKTSQDDWQSLAGRDPAYHVVIDDESKPVKAVFRRLPGVPTDLSFTTHDAARVFRRLGFAVANTSKPLCLIGTNNRGDPGMKEFLTLFKDGATCASWWSFPIKEGARGQLEKPFSLYVNIGDNRIKYRINVIDFQTTDDPGGMVSPWPEMTPKEERNVTRVGDSVQQVCRTWFLADGVELLPRTLRVSDFVPAPALSKTTSLLNQSTFGYAYLKTDHEPSATPAPDTSTLFLEPGKLEVIRAALIHEKNIVLQGPPGVGKTHLAEVLPYLMEGVTTDTVEWVQFHQSFSYEDFVQGYRPNDDGHFVRQDGIFLRFCERARKAIGKPHVLIIDELNRGNLSRIFGEVMMLIESSKRLEAWALNLTYSKRDEARFFVPDNVYVIGLMNTADRSLALVDYALRRRFAFFDLTPRFNSEIFREVLQHRGVAPGVIDLIVERLTALNDEIAADQDLGEGFQIGHSYFCPRETGTYGRDWYDQVIDQKIDPLLREYWFDKSKEFRSEKIKALKA